ncbi:MAG: hypothetical protein AAGK37_09160 [Pseudomonadota bacterium]
MSEFLPKEVRAGMELARKRAQRNASRLRLQVGDQSFTILRLWDKGLSLEEDADAPARGYADIYDGQRHLTQCLIVASDNEPGERCFEFKRATAAHDNAPRDYAVEKTAPAGLLPPR